MPVAHRHPSPAAPAERILAAASRQLFAYGYNALTMDELARELGVSKKTLYVHFATKDALVETVLNRFAAEVRRLADDLFADRELNFVTKFSRLVEAMIRRFAQVNPLFVRDLQRFAPHLYRKLEELRYKNIPYVFGQVLRQGQAAGMVRPELDPGFAIEFWRTAIVGLMQPDAIERTGLTPDQVFQKSINLFFTGLLTPAGRKDYEKLFPS
jgi:AcrR family transcriptional regulator